MSMKVDICGREYHDPHSDHVGSSIIYSAFKQTSDEGRGRQ
jgi:hypothetical protein